MVTSYFITRSGLEFKSYKNLLFFCESFWKNKIAYFLGKVIKFWGDFFTLNFIAILALFRGGFGDFQNMKKMGKIVGRDTRRNPKKKSHLPLGGVNNIIHSNPIYMFQTQLFPLSTYIVFKRSYFKRISHQCDIQNIST